MRGRMVLLGLLLSLGGGPVMAGELKTSKVDYSAGVAPLEGYVARDAEATGKRPAVLIVHDWMGISDFTRGRAEALAKLGYVAFAADIYGKGVRPKSADEAREQATKFKKNPTLMRAHVRAAFDQLLSMKEVDPSRIAVMGYCFGGTVALELARSGAPLAGTATFHGGLGTESPADPGKFPGRVLVMHGADDPFVPPKEVEAFKKEMKQAKVRLEFISYPGAVHAFAVPGAGNDKSKGAAYDAEADRKSWATFLGFLSEVFQKN